MTRCTMLGGTPSSTSHVAYKFVEPEPAALVAAHVTHRLWLTLEPLPMLPTALVGPLRLIASVPFDNDTQEPSPDQRTAVRDPRQAIAQGAPDDSGQPRRERHYPPAGRRSGPTHHSATRPPRPIEAQHPPL